MEKVWLYAVVGSFAPILLWLFFWMREDSHQPEPKKLILKTLIFGSVAAFFAVWIEYNFSNFLKPEKNMEIWFFSFVEEFSKLSAVFLAAIGSVWNNEKEDPMLYMITGALGFSAIENMYFIIDYINSGEYIKSLINGSYRFIGATLLHISASALIGFFISLVFFKKKSTRILMAFLGLLLAIIIHSVFNILISNPEYQNITFYGTWGFIIIILLLFEFINKKEKYRVIKNGKVYYWTKKEHQYDNYKNDNFRKKFF